MAKETDISTEWHPFDSGATLGAAGSESGTILQDEEHPAGARITLERGTTIAPFAITCGIYGGRFLHTVFVGSELEASTAYESMRTQLTELAVRDDDIYEALVAFTRQFP